MERCNSIMADEAVDRCYNNKEKFHHADGQNNTLPRAKKISPGCGGMRTKDLTMKIALYDDFTNKESASRSITPIFKRTAESLINSKRRKPVATDNPTTKFQSAVTNGKRGTVKVSFYFVFLFYFFHFNELLNMILIFVALP